MGALIRSVYGNASLHLAMPCERTLKKVRYIIQSIIPVYVILSFVCGSVGFAFVIPFVSLLFHFLFHFISFYYYSNMIVFYGCVTISINSRKKQKHGNNRET